MAITCGTMFIALSHGFSCEVRPSAQPHNPIRVRVRVRVRVRPSAQSHDPAPMCATTFIASPKCLPSSAYSSPSSAYIASLSSNAPSRVGDSARARVILRLGFDLRLGVRPAEF